MSMDGPVINGKDGKKTKSSVAGAIQLLLAILIEFALITNDKLIIIMFLSIHPHHCIYR